MIHTIGKTTDGKTIVSGAYRYYETHGLPLDVVLSALWTRGAMPCWETLISEACAAGMKRERILARLENDVADVYGAAFRDVVLRRLREDRGVAVERRP